MKTVLNTLVVTHTLGRMSGTKTKIVIIGGGMSGMAAAFGLTSDPNWQAKYEITVLQLGWRLGGKGASGRNAELEERIEEHGLHVWGGFYENAFRVMRSCYLELNRAPTAPLATWDEAFKPSPTLSWMENLSTVWLPWNNDFQEYPNSTPGDEQPMPSLLEGLIRIVEWVIQTAVGSGTIARRATAGGMKTAHPAWVRSVLSVAEVLEPRIPGLGSTASVPGWLDPLKDADHLLRTLSADANTHAPEALQAIVFLLKAFRRLAIAGPSAGAETDGERRALILIDLGIAEVIGILSDGVLTQGFNVLDNEDLRAWYTRHGASAESVNSAVVNGVYDFIFAYRNGDSTKPSLGAGSGLRCIFRLIMWYKGAIFWKMQAGMGDTVFAPLYLVLQKRGVNFGFFQKVENLGLSGDGKSVATIEVGVQATTLSGPYNPLVTVNNLPCWPNQPLYPQLVQGQQLQQQGIDLEDPWANWPSVNTYTMQAGSDFDVVILATSLAPLKEIAQELIAVSPAWSAMVENVQTTQTQAFQLWMNPTLSALGWTDGSPVLTAYAHPTETWADMSQVIPREVWPSGQEPRSIGYFCGALIDANPIPPYSDHGFPAQQASEVKQNSLNWIKAIYRHFGQTRAAEAHSIGTCSTIRLGSPARVDLIPSTGAPTSLPRSAMFCRCRDPHGIA